MTIDADYRLDTCDTCREGSDHVTCNQCDWNGSVDYESDTCPQCNTTGTLTWAHQASKSTVGEGD